MTTPSKGPVAGPSAAKVGRSGDALIDGLLSGSKWAGTRVSYSNPDSRKDYEASHPEALTDFSRLSPRQLQAVHTVLADGRDGFAVSDFTGLDLAYAGGSGKAAIRLANTGDPGTAYAYYPDGSGSGGDVFFGGTGRAPKVGNFDWFTTIHEIGHALGLKHGHEKEGRTALPHAVDSMEFSVMTYKSYVGSDAEFVYNEAFGYAQSYMMADIAALQFMYGADFSSNAGNTTYSWSPTTGATYVDGGLAIKPGANRIFQTIWDGDGRDTYDLSNYATDLHIHLMPGAYSTFSRAQSADLGGGPNKGLARGNVFNALQYENDPRSLIENAAGGSGDDNIRGNVAGNRLVGNAGNDVLNGASGNDVLVGGAGGDVLIGGPGADRFDFNAASQSVPRFRAGQPLLDEILGRGAPAVETGDRIDVSGIDANTARAGDQAFAWGGELPAAGTRAGTLYTSDGMGGTVVRASVDADRIWEFAFEIVDHARAASWYVDDYFIL